MGVVESTVSKDGGERVATETGVTIQTLRGLLNAFNRHDIDAVMSFFADDCVLEMPRGPEPWGRRLEGQDRVREGLASRFAGIPDVHYGDDRHWLAGDQLTGMPASLALHRGRARSGVSNDHLWRASLRNAIIPSS